MTPPGADAADGDPVPHDGGADPSPTEDGGDAEDDAGDPPEDAGVTPSDAGDVAEDAGATESDAGPGGDDGGEPPEDAGLDEDAGAPTDDAGVDDDDAGAASDAGDTSDAGDEGDAGSVVDDAGPSLDAGPNNAPSVTSFTASADSVDDPGSITVTVVAADADGDPLTYTYSVAGTVPAGLSIDPAGPVSDASAAVAFDGTVPRGTYTIEVLVSDGEDSASATLEVTVNNHAPTVAAGEDLTVLPTSPAVATTLAPVITDVDLLATPADVLTVSWTASDTLPGGIVFDITDPFAPTVTVDRAVYEQDPSAVGYAFTATITVVDSEGATATDTVLITIADERGGHVDNTSAFAGTGPAGYCGSLARPCNTVADAQVNLRSLRAADASVPNELLVATTGTDYPLDGTVVLEAGTALRCGFDATALDADGEWSQTADRTPLRSTADTGVLVEDGAGSGDVSLIERCDLEMLDQTTDAASRIGVDVNSAGALLRDNRVIGSAAESTNGAAVVVRGAGGGEVTIEGNELTGGAATNNVAAVYLNGRGATLTGNTLTGGASGDLATGVLVDSAAVTLTDNDSVGGTANLTAGLLLQAGVDGSVLTDNHLKGTNVVDGLQSYGAILRAGTSSSGNELRSGQAALGAGLLVDAAVSVTSVGDTFVGEGTGSAIGVSVEADGTLALTDATVSAPGNGNPGTSVGARTGDGGTLEVTDSTLAAGDAIGASTGVQGDAATSAITLRGTDVSSGDSNTQSSIAVEVLGGALVVEASDAVAAPVITAGTAGLGASLGISVDCGAGALAPRIESSVVSASSAGISVGVRTAACAGTTLTGTVVTAGTATLLGAPDTGVSVGLAVEGGEVTASGGSFTGGAGAVSSAGVVVDAAEATLSDLAATAGTVTPLPSEARATSAGVVLVDPSAATTLTAVSATGGDVGPATESQSFGVVVVTEDATPPLPQLAIVDSTVTAGDAQDRSAALWVGEAFDGLTVSGSTLTGGAAGSSAGLVLLVAGADASVEDNSILAGTASGGASIDAATVSVGVWMATCHGCFIQRNVIEGGGVTVAGRSLGLRSYAGPLSPRSYVTNNVIRAGEGPVARALELSGDAGDTLRVLHNNLFGGGLTDGVSAAVHMGHVQPAGGLGGNRYVASFGGNIVDPGIGDTRVGYHETCYDLGTTVYVVGPFEARNTDFWPSVASDSSVVYVRDASVSLFDCASADLTSIAAVNGATAYGATNADGCTSQSFDRDPAFIDGRDVAGLIRDGMHIGAASPLRGAAPGTYANAGCGGALSPLWDSSALGELADIDGQLRPLPASAALDIGADEVD